MFSEADDETCVDDDDIDKEYYNVLNVNSEADETEISTAYKKLAKLYHPDKHTDPERKLQAEMLFAKIKTAYEVLSDSHKRAIYDCLGKKGLEEQGWEIVARKKSPREIREEYEELVRERARRRLQQETNPTSRLQMNINASQLFERDTDMDMDMYDTGFSLAMVEISEIILAQTIEAPINDRDKLLISGNVNARNGTGNGCIECSYKRTSSHDAWQQLKFAFGRGPSLALMIYRKLTARTFINCTGGIAFTSKGVKPSTEISIGNSLGSNTVGYLNYSSNWLISESHDMISLKREQSGMSTMIVYSTPTCNLMGSIQFGVPYTYLMFSASKNFKLKYSLNPDTKVRSAVKIGTFGVVFECGGETPLTRHSMIGATMVVGVPVGVTLRLKFTRASQTYIFPILLSDEVVIEPIFYGTFCSLLGWFLLKKLILEPIDETRRKTELEKRNALYAAKVAEVRNAALASVSLMLDRYERILQIINGDQSNSRVLIVEAFYGQLNASLNKNRSLSIKSGWNFSLFTSKKEDPDDELNKIEKNLAAKNGLVVDVKIPVQCMMSDTNDEQIVFYAGISKSNFAGFYDPAPGSEVPNSLFVKYRHKGILHRVIVSDTESLIIPKMFHRMPSSPSPLDTSATTTEQ